MVQMAQRFHADPFLKHTMVSERGQTHRWVNSSVVPAGRIQPGAGKEAQKKGSWGPRKQVSEDFPDEVFSKESHFKFQKAVFEYPVNSKVEYFRANVPLINYMILAKLLNLLETQFPSPVFINIIGPIYRSNELTIHGSDWPQ